jgi:hypothetical protein
MSLDVEKYKKVLHVDLDNMEVVSKINESLWIYIGGVAVSYRLLSDYYEDNPIIISTGPLAGCFPYISKGNLLFSDNGNLVEKYGGGTFPAFLNFAGYDAIVIKGNSANNIQVNIGDDITIEQIDGEFDPKDYDLSLSKNAVLSKNYFSFGDFSDSPLNLKANIGFKITKSIQKNLFSYYDYENWYTKILDRYKELTVEPRNNPSCTGCPMGCDFSSAGEDNMKISILPRTLISCVFAESIYKDIPLVFGCLNSVGYDYKHNDLENLPQLFGELKSNLNAKII